MLLLLLLLLLGIWISIVVGLQSLRYMQPIL